MRTTEQLAPDQLQDLLLELSKLVTNQPTTAEIEEATYRVLPAVGRLLRDWISARHLIQANAANAATFRERHPQLSVLVCPAIPVETPEEAAELDRIEHVHPVFAPVLRGIAG